SHVRVVGATENGGRTRVQVGEQRLEMRLAIPGRHNVLNAAAALSVARVLDLPLRPAAEALATFTGVRRRFEDRGVAARGRFADDYAHHPTEIAATLAAARQAGSNGLGGSPAHRVVAVFQPHRYT